MKSGSNLERILTFPTNDCSMCTMSPRLVSVAQDENIEILTMASLERLEGDPGAFTATVCLQPRYVDIEKCTGCGECSAVCPVKIDDEFNRGLSKRKAIYRMYPQAVPNTSVIDRERCIGCRKCERACEAGAICFDETARSRDIEIGGVVVAGGYDLYDAHRRGEFGYDRYPNVVTSLDFERLLSASGPTAGHVTRPSDGKEARRVAFIQCVGSRDTTERGNEYCSGVCCMYASKAAMLAQEHVEGLETTIFMIDMRAHGKGYERYYRRARDAGVRYVRSMVSAVRQEFATGDLQVGYAGEDGQNHAETFDLVVLSVGLECRADAAELARVLGVSLDEDGFVRTGLAEPMASSREGVTVCGAAAGPMDIPDSVTGASAAAAMLAKQLAPARFSCITTPTFPPQRDVADEPPRAGVFVCHCGNNIAGVVDVEDLVTFAETLPGVAYAERNLYACSPEALRKSKDLLASAVAKACHLAPLEEQTQPVTHAALIVGGGLAGMVAAENLAEQGFDVHLVEKTDQLGGQLRHIRRTLDGEDVPALMNRLIGQVQANERITTHLNTTVHSHGGSVGNFESKLISANGDRQTVRHGATIVAAGAEMYEPTEYGHGQSDKVITQRELERRLDEGEADEIGTVVMIQCVGCRSDDRPYCSRICCAEAVKNALEIKSRRPDCRVVILYRDVRTFGRLERHYAEARRLGVQSVRYDTEQEPQVDPDGTVRVTDLTLGRELTFQADLVALSAAGGV